MYFQVYLIGQQKFKGLTVKKVVGHLLKSGFTSPVKVQTPTNIQENQGFQNICFITKASWYVVRRQSYLTKKLIIFNKNNITFL